MMLLAWISLGVFLVSSAHGGRILAIIPFPSKSRHIFSSAVLTTLASRGHQVIEYSPFPPDIPLSNHTHVGLHTLFESNIGKVGAKHHNTEKISIWTTSLHKIIYFWEVHRAICEHTFRHKTIKKLLSSKENFDLVITESSYGEESLLVFGHIFSAPTVTLDPLAPWSVMNRNAGNSLAVAYAPELMPFVATDRMSFRERLFNSISVLWTLYFYYTSHIPKHQDILNAHYQEAPLVSDMIVNVSLNLTNTQAMSHYSRPLSPNMIPIGGIHINDERTHLPDDIKSFMDSATSGVIYFSFGTAIPVHRLPMGFLNIFVNVFKTLTQMVLWKIDLKSLPPTSGNVMTAKWVPQQGVLAHPNCVLFITQGGLFSQQEAIHAGVPTVAIPFSTDQPYNARYGEHRGVGVTLDFHSLTEEKLFRALTKVLGNSSYKDDARRLSTIYRDRPVSPADSLVFWVEYVMRHRGAPHHRPTSAAMAWYQLALLDVSVFVMVALFIMSIASCFVIMRIRSLFCDNKVSNY